MYTPRHIPQNFNPKAATFEIDADLLGPFSKIAVAKGSRLIDYCPIAQDIYGRGGDIKRVDLAASGGRTTISIVRSVVEWSEKMTDYAADFIAKSIDARPPVYIEALARDIPGRATLKTDDNPVASLISRTFQDQVAPVLSKHGGALELLNVDVKPTGAISSEVALVGSCHGCGSAEKSTLSEAESRIKSVLKDVKAMHAENPQVQALHFTGIRLVEIKDLVLTKS